LLEPVFNAPGKRGRNTEMTCDASWTRSRTSPRPVANGVTSSRRADCGRVCVAVPPLASQTGGGGAVSPGRGASNGGFTIHDRGGSYVRTKGAKRVVAVDVTGLPVAALVAPASTHGHWAGELMLEHPTQQDAAPGSSSSWWTWASRQPSPATPAMTAASRSVGSDGMTSSRCSARSGTLGASRSPSAASDAAADWRSRSGTPLRQRPAGFRSPASRRHRDTSPGTGRAKRPAAATARPPAVTSRGNATRSGRCEAEHFWL